jgi:predicted carbohydrate-binding protein with CBM5 and CBM33 domain
MNLRTRLSLLAAVSLIAPFFAVLGPASPASAHGWVTSPASRQDQCATGAVSNCGDIQWEPQSVEAPKGARSCSGGSRFSVLDNEGKGWKVHSIGSTATFTWRKTAMHRTTNWEYFVDGQLHRTISGNASQPPSTVSHSISGLPSGRHKILAIWNIYDTPMAFYSCIDVNVNGGGGGPDPGPSQPPGGSCGPAWSASAVYTQGATVSHNGRKWSAQWWTQGEAPGSTGQWGVWKDLGAC